MPFSSPQVDADDTQPKTHLLSPPALPKIFHLLSVLPHHSAGNKRKGECIKISILQLTRKTYDKSSLGVGKGLN